MKKIRAFTVLFCFLSAIGYAESGAKLHLSISLTEGEHSRDSNSASTAISINGTELVYDKSYSGYGAGKRKAVHKQIKIGAEEISKLREVIAERRLLVSNRLDHSINGPGRYSVATISLALGQRRGRLKVSGTISEIENEPLYKNAQALIEEIRRIVEAHE